jgi:hypothetical protein
MAQVPGYDELRVDLDGGSEYVAVIGIRKIEHVNQGLVPCYKAVPNRRVHPPRRMPAFSAEISGKFLISVLSASSESSVRCPSG